MAQIHEKIRVLRKLLRDDDKYDLSKTIEINASDDLCGEDTDYLDKKFPKGDKRRGEAMVLLALARQESMMADKITQITHSKTIFPKTFTKIEVGAEEESLSDKTWTIKPNSMVYDKDGLEHGSAPRIHCLMTEDVKEKVRSVQERLKEKLTWEMIENVSDLWVQKVINKIFKEEFWEELA